jgi:hypothetical protein
LSYARPNRESPAWSNAQRHFRWLRALHFHCCGSHWRARDFRCRYARHSGWSRICHWPEHWTSSVNLPQVERYRLHETPEAGRHCCDFRLRDAGPAGCSPTLAQVCGYAMVWLDG